MTDQTTKNKILKIAHRLFAEKGLTGVSIRELARECDVNIAAINYHFKQKENLYVETLKYSIEQTESDVRLIFEKTEPGNITDFVLSIFKHFRENSEDLKTGFKFVLSSTHFTNLFEENPQKFCGPPGAEYLYQYIKRELPNAISDDIEWAVRVIFTQVIHKAIILCNESLCKSLEHVGLNQDKVIADLRRTIKAVLADIKNK